MVFFLTSLLIFSVAVAFGGGIGYVTVGAASVMNGDTWDEHNKRFKGFLLDDNEILMAIKGTIDKVLKPIADLLPDQANMVFGMLFPTSVLDIITEFVPTNALFGALGKVIKKASKAVTTATARAAAALGKGSQYMIGDAFGEITEKITKEIREAMLDAAKQGKKEAKALGMKGKEIDKYILQRVEVATEAARRNAQDRATADLMGVDVSDLRTVLIRQGIDPDASARSIFNTMRLRTMSGFDEAAELAADVNRVLGDADYAVNYVSDITTDAMQYVDNYASQSVDYADNYIVAGSSDATLDLVTQSATRTRRTMTALSDAKSLQKTVADGLELDDIAMQVDNMPSVMRVADPSVVKSTSRGKPRSQMNPEVDLGTLNPRPPGARQHLTIKTSTGHGSVKGQVADVAKWIFGGDPRTKGFWLKKGKHVAEQMVIDQVIANGFAANAHLNNGYSSYWDDMGLDYSDNEDDIDIVQPWGDQGPTGGAPPGLTTPVAWFDDTLPSDDDGGSDDETPDTPNVSSTYDQELSEFRGSERRRELQQTNSGDAQAAGAPSDAASLALLAALGVAYVSSKI